MSEIHEVADAIVDALNAAPFATAGGQPVYVAKRVYAVRLSLATDVSNGPLVYVVPGADDASPLDRDGLEEELLVRVFVVAKVAGDTDISDPASNADLDPLVALCRQILHLFQPGDTAADAQWSGSTYAPLYDVRSLEKDGTFLGVLHFTFNQYP